MTLRLVLLLCAIGASGETRKPNRTISDVGGRVYSIAYSPDGNLVAAGGEDKRVRIWDANTGTLKLAMGGQTGSIWAVAFSPDGKSVASASLDGTVRILNVGSGKFERTLDAAGARGMAFLPGMESVLAMSARDRVIFWNFVTGQRLKTLERGGVKIGPLAFRPDGKVLVSGGSDGSIRLWDTATGAFIRSSDAGSPVMSVAVSAAHVAAGCEDGKVKLLAFDGREGDGQESELSGTNTAVYAVAFSADGAQLAAAGNNHTIDVWEVKSGQVLMSFEGHTQEALAVAFSPNGRSIVSAGADGTIRYWTQ